VRYVRVAAVGLLVASAMILPSSEASARCWHNGWGWRCGPGLLALPFIAAGTVVAGAAAIATAPVRAIFGPPYYTTPPAYYPPSGYYPPPGYYRPPGYYYGPPSPPQCAAPSSTLPVFPSSRAGRGSSRPSAMPCRGCRWPRHDDCRRWPGGERRRPVIRFRTGRAPTVNLLVVKFRDCQSGSESPKTDYPSSCNDRRVALPPAAVVSVETVRSVAKR
jgi:hypothetical protein